MGLIQDNDALVELEFLLETLSEEDLPAKKVNNVKTKFKTGCELRMSTQIGEYDMDYIILDLGSDVNILMCQTWKIMGNPPLEWSPIQLSISNKEKVLPIGRLSQVQVDIEGLCTFVDFEVINIVDDTNPYPAPLGIDWAMGNQTIINFKRRILSFEDDEMRVVAPLEPLEGQRYIEPVFNEGKVDHLDNI